MAALIGLDAKLYRGVAGAPAATEMTNVRDVTLADEKGEANISRRGSRWSVVKATRRKVSVNFTMINDDTDADLIALRAAYAADTPLAFKILDKTAGKGVDADWEIMKMERGEPDETEQTISVTIKPTFVTRWPAEV
ncbi:MAG: hypothetical protein JW741_25440 [Sedimentisphaerales bacterium]|nr:hypothetical protein [Sedimentisphaerales bacterium]